MEVFEVRGSELAVADASDLFRQLAAVDSSVPRRTEGRRSHHRERYCIVRLLHTLASSSLITFPLRVVKQEAPDFLLCLSDRSITGVEVTEVGTERSQRAATQLERSPTGTFLEGEGNLRLPGEPLQGRGYVGDEGARELADLILAALAEKTRSLNQSHFARADRYELLVYDNSHLVMYADLGPLSVLLKPLLTEWLAQDRSERNFSLVSVLRDSELLYDCSGAACVLRVTGPEMEGESG